MKFNSDIYKAGYKVVKQDSLEGQILEALYDRTFEEFKQDKNVEELNQAGLILKSMRLGNLTKNESEVIGAGIFPKGRKLVELWRSKGTK